MIQVFKPILFSTPMVKAILNGEKTMTHRIPNGNIRNKYYEYEEMARVIGCGDGVVYSLTEREFYEQYPPYAVEDILWVRETWANAYLNGGPDGFIDAFAYRADGAITYPYDAHLKYSDSKVSDLHASAISGWRPSIHMPKKACRLFLRVTDVRMERLHCISGNLDELECEGINIIVGAFQASWNFAGLWDRTVKPSDIGTLGWDANPWVWVIQFERTERPDSF